MTDRYYELRAKLSETLSSLGIQAIEPLEEIEMTLTIGWDSASHIEVMLALEEAFGIELSDDEVEKLTNAERIINHLEKAKCNDLK
ncbi:acyl carrier protein [Rhodobacteraceae bacterium 63075]|nr:acyl carrier protein [Rhodobacteraceae bacterium 63075]